jgi:rubrerythrin
MTKLARIKRWLKDVSCETRYAELKHYPELAQFGREEAMARLQRCMRENVRIPLLPWRIAPVLLTFAIPAVYITRPGGTLYTVVLMIALMQICFACANRKYRTRIRAVLDVQLAAEANQGHLLTCLKCGYDLRSSPDQCPECNASSRLTPLRQGVEQTCPK